MLMLGGVMTRRKIRGAVACLLFALLLVPAAVSADPITVTGGSLFIDHLGSLELTGERGFSLTASVSTTSGSVAFDDCIRTSCAPGNTVSVDAVWLGLDIRSGVLTFEGETYRVREGEAGAGVQFDGSFTAPSIASSAVISTPFTLVPLISGTGGSSFFSLPPPGGSFALQGSGIATINLSQYFESSPEGTTFFDGWKVDSVRYDFSAAEPVPEPGTMLLAGLGIAGIARRVARRRR